MAQRSILNYFAKTPTPKSTNGSPTTPKTSDNVLSGPGTSTILVTPKRPLLATTPSSSKSGLKSKNTTPSSNGKSRQKRAPSTDPGIQSEAQTKLKRPKTEDGSPTKDFVEGSLVWAKVEGYPFWPAMVRGRKSGKPFTRKNRTEFHVQFFDKPPTRAWIRKPDLKLFQSSTDGAVPPARTDPCWIESCKTADNARTMSPAKRIEKYWVHFEDESEDEEAMDTSETDPTPENPKASSSAKSSSRGGRQVISDSSEEGEGSESKKEKTGILTTPVTHKRNGRAPPRIRIQKMESDEDEDEYNPSSADVTVESEEQSSGVESESEAVSEEDNDEDAKIPRSSKKPAAKGKPTLTPKTPKTTRVPNNTPQSSAKRADFQNRIAKFSNYDSPVTSPKTNGSGSGEKWTHLTLKFLKPEEIRDKKSRRPDHPDYDPKTLYIPQKDLDSFSPGVRQWWILKSTHFDTILFFKLGKFYELYHMDAVIAVQELGLIYMKGDYAHCGFPEIAYSRYAPTLVAKGYKVARIEQTETPDMMTERCKRMSRPSKFDRVVKREICQITTKGIRLASSQDSASIPFLPGSEYLYAIAERAQDNGETEYGTCFIDTTLGTFFIGQFKDDRNFSRLRTMFAHHKPAQILYEKGKTSSAVMSILNNMGGVRKDALTSTTEFWNGEKVLTFLSEGSYFKTDESSDNLEWPKNLESIFNKNSLQLTPVEGWELGLKCLGGVVWFLKECLVEHDVITLRRFEFYFPVDMKPEDANISPDQCYRFDNMVLDGATLRNLEIAEGPKSLFSIMDKCSTQFGKRLLRHWTCVPEANPENIRKRQDAIEELMNLEDLMDQVIPMLKSLQDLERLLGKIHTLGSLHRSTNHPDARASMYEEKQYSRRKIGDLTNALKNFKTCISIINTINGFQDQILSEYLSDVISKFPSLEKLLDFFDNAFDHKAAIKDGKIQPSPGVDSDYDAAFQAVADVQKEADAYLKEVKEQLKTKVVYFGSDKKRFQLEVVDKVRVPHNFEMTSSRKGFKRYSTAQTKALLARMIQSEVNRENVVKDITRRVFAQFDSNREIWNEAVRTISVIDVLFSLTIFSKSQENMCRPSVVLSEKPFINIVDGRHPAVSQDTYIPNSTFLGSQVGGDKSSGTFVLLTGPNMGGKSTLMRQIGLITVLAHMGAYVPAIKCEMSVVDRIFTRLGANDNIGEGESTFFVELSETSSILQHATSNSLVLMDELGRGTATYDGTAIAYSVAHALAFRESRTIFSTHYHNLVEAVQEWPPVQLGHMACMVEKENEDDDDPTQETITFLYKLARGPCPKSYGFNAARLAGIPHDVIRVAHKKAKELESVVNKVDLFRKLCSKIAALTLSPDDTKLGPVVA